VTEAEETPIFCSISSSDPAFISRFPTWPNPMKRNDTKTILFVVDAQSTDQSNCSQSTHKQLAQNLAVLHPSWRGVLQYRPTEKQTGSKKPSCIMYLPHTLHLYLMLILLTIYFGRDQQTSGIPSKYADKNTRYYIYMKFKVHYLKLK
jgi:hypothetical protein